jgi:hypothetical protein
MIDVADLFPGPIAPATLIGAVFVMAARRVVSGSRVRVAFDRWPDALDALAPGLLTLRNVVRSSESQALVDLAPGARLADFARLCEALGSSLVAADPAGWSDPVHAADPVARALHPGELVGALMGHSLTLGGRRLFRRCSARDRSRAALGLSRIATVTGVRGYWLAPGGVRTTADLIEQLAAGEKRRGSGPVPGPSLGSTWKRFPTPS